MRLLVTFAVDAPFAEGEGTSTFVLSRSYGFTDAASAHRGIEAMLRVSDHLELLDEHNRLWPIEVARVRAFAVRPA